MRIAIAGGTGTVGRHVVLAAKVAGHDTVVLSRSVGIDLMSPAGLAEALAGVDAVVDVSSPSTLSTKKAIAFFGTVTDNLLTAERTAGVPHHVLLSIIGAADASSGYYAGKAFQERQVTDSGSQWSMLRTTQFHEFAQQTADRGTTLGLFLAPNMCSQPIAAAEVAAELVTIATHGPQGIVPASPDRVKNSCPISSADTPGPQARTTLCSASHCRERWAKSCATEDSSPRPARG